MEDQVRAFHEKNGYPVDQEIGSECRWQLEECKDMMAEWSVAISSTAHSMLDKDPAMYRLHLMMEELSETCGALLTHDRVKLADGLGDLLYVIVGTFVTYGIPMQPVFDEIHRANMSKKKRTDNDIRMRNKGDWKPPQLEKLV